MTPLPLQFLRELLRIWKAAAFLLMLRIHQPPIDDDVKNASAALYETWRGAQFRLQHGSQTDRLWLVVSLHAISDGYVHGDAS